MTNVELLVSSSDIAELVDERLAVISTWRNRFREGPNAFPAPVGGTPARPLFAFSEVNEWVSRNRPEKQLGERLLPVRIWSVIRDLTSSGQDQFDLVYLLHRALGERKAELESRLLDFTPPSQAASFTRSEESEEAVEGIRALLSGCSAEDLVQVSEFALGRLSAGYGRKGGDIGAVDSNIARVLAAAAVAHQVRTTGDILIFDPSCGIAESVIKVIENLRRAGRRSRVIGIELNSRVAEIARVRLLLRGIDAVIETGDTLSTRAFLDDRPDVILAEPPLGAKWAGLWHPDDPRSTFGMPSSRNSDLAWVIDAAARLNSGGFAFVLTSTAALSRLGAEERIRNALIRSGAIESIIALPPNMLQYSSAALALWVVRSIGADNSNRLVRLVDATTPDLGEGGTAKRAEWVRQHIAQWVIDPSVVDPSEGVWAAAVHLEELSEAAMDLTPTRWVAEVGGSDLLYNLGELSNMFGREVANFQRNVSGFDELPTTPHMVTLREITELPDVREAKLWSGRSVANDDAPSDTVTSRDIAAGRLRSISDVDTDGGFRTEAGDILFTTMGRVRALVDLDGGRRLGNGVYALRLDPGSRLDPAFVSMCLAARWNQRHLKGATIKHAKPGDLEIPLLPLELQMDWLKAFTDLADVRAAAQNLVELADELEVAAQDALRFGGMEGR